MYLRKTVVLWPSLLSKYRSLFSWFNYYDDKWIPFWPFQTSNNLLLKGSSKSKASCKINRYHIFKHIFLMSSTILFQFFVFWIGSSLATWVFGPVVIPLSKKAPPIYEGVGSNLGSSKYTCVCKFRLKFISYMKNKK